MSGLDPHSTHNVDSDGHPKTESDGWGLLGVTGSKGKEAGIHLNVDKHAVGGKFCGYAN